MGIGVTCMPRTGRLGEALVVVDARAQHLLHTLDAVQVAGLDGCQQLAHLGQARQVGHQLGWVRFFRHEGVLSVEDTAFIVERLMPFHVIYLSLC